MLWPRPFAQAILGRLGHVGRLDSQALVGNSINPKLFRN